MTDFSLLAAILSFLAVTGLRDGKLEVLFTVLAKDSLLAEPASTSLLFDDAAGLIVRDFLSSVVGSFFALFTVSFR